MTDARGLDGPEGWRNVVAGFLSMATVFGVVYSFGAFFNPMADEFGTGRSATSLVFSITAGAYFLLGAVTGPAVDRIGPKPVLLVGAVAMGVGLALTSLVDRLWIGYLTYGAGVGIAAACGYVPMLAVVGGWFVRRRSMALGIAVAGIGVGTFGVAPLAAKMIDELGWRSTYRYLAVAGATILLLCAALATKPPAAAAHAASATDATDDTPSPVRSPQFAILYGSGILISLALFLVFTYLAPFAEEHGIDRVRSAALVGFVGGASIAGRLLLGALADRLGSIRTYRACFLAMAASYVLWVTTTTYPGLVAFAIAFGVAYGGFIALSPAVMADIFGTATMGRLVGVLYTGAAIGALVGPPVAGFIVDRTGDYRWATGPAGLLALAGWAVLTRLRPAGAMLDR